MIKVLSPLIFFAFSSVAYADRVECNKQQSSCSVEHLEITIDERVVFLNEDTEVVAVGEVKSMSGSKRTVKVLKNYGRITKKTTVKLIDNRVQTIDQLDKYYNIYQAKSKWVAGGSAGFATFNVGEFLSGFEFSGFGQLKYNEFVDWVGRFGLTIGSGKISPDNIGVIQDPIDVTAYSFLPGVAGTLFRKNAVSIRGEFCLGLSYVSATVKGDADKVSGQGYNSKMENGFGLGARLEGGAQIDLNEEWEMGIFAAISRIHNAQGTVIGASVSRAL